MGKELTPIVAWPANQPCCVGEVQWRSGALGRVCMPLAAGLATTGGDDAMWEDADTASVQDTSNAGRWLAASAAKPLTAPVAASSKPSLRSSAQDAAAQALNTPRVQFTPGPAGGRSTGSKYRKTPGLKVWCALSHPCPHTTEHGMLRKAAACRLHGGHHTHVALLPVHMAGVRPSLARNVCGCSVPAAGPHAGFERQR